MKTPREILLERHQVAAPKLDAIRNGIVTELNRQAAKAPGYLSDFVSWCLGGFNKIWLELIFPSRRIWAGLATIWIFIFILNFSQRDKSDLMAKNISPSPEMILAFWQQEKLLAELTGQNEPQTAEPPKTFLPRPSSERPFEILMT